jgi:6-phosphogluconolactonase (cycloisomerase 2 family)
MMSSVLRRLVPALILGLLPALVAAAPAAASPGAGHVYVNDNTAGANTISAFTRQADGTLTPLHGSPFPAGGAGTGTGLASQGALQVSSNGRYLIAVDAGSNQISVLRIRQNGDPVLLPGRVASSDGVLPVSVAEHDGLVYVANAGPGGENYTGFTLNGGGHLRPLPGSTFSLPDSPPLDNAQPGDVLFNSTGTNLVGTRVNSSQIDSFSVGPDGRLTPAPDSPLAAQGLGPFGSEFRPTNPDQLFVSNAHNVGAGTGTVSAFSVSGDGTLSSIGASPFADRQTAPCWVEITHDGQFLFTVNTGSGTVSSYSIAPDGTLTPGASVPAGAGSVDARLSPDGQNLYVNESGTGALGEFTVSGGNLTGLGTVTVPTGPGAAGLATN